MAHTGAMVAESAVSRPSSIVADRGRVGGELLVGGDLGDPPREVDVLLGHPLDDVLGALVVAVDGVVADQLEVDVPLPDRHARVVAERVARLTHRGDEPRAGAEVVDQVARVQPLGQLAPVGQVRLGDLLALEHVHGRGPYPSSSAAERARSATSWSQTSPTRSYGTSFEWGKRTESFPERYGETRDSSGSSKTGTG